MDQSGKETRKATRIELRLPVTITIDGQSFKGEIQDFSEGGAFVSCAHSSSIGGAVRLEIAFQGDFLLANKRTNWDLIRTQTPLPDSLVIDATVQWLIPPPRQGFGLKFGKMDKKNQKTITEIARICAKSTKVA